METWSQDLRDAIDELEDNYTAAMDTRPLEPERIADLVGVIKALKALQAGLDSIARDLGPRG
jgi:hypothetical protein